MFTFAGLLRKIFTSEEHGLNSMLYTSMRISYAVRGIIFFCTLQSCSSDVHMPEQLCSTASGSEGRSEKQLMRYQQP